ncbi:extracellular solute-binding protein [Mangrovicoccus ximenensis]|uniref:extracellular solute-binding protein n=1 Tax=Mangrovicoccus ximenensis TaxID=1911570 RepID=UPI000D39DABB|nr:extracellular solute-binding protein [Mangrovicoccus ximenensis]
MPVTFPRRALLAATAAFGLSGLPTLAQDQSITIMIWGTTWQTAFEQIAANFTEETGIEVQLMPQSNSGESLAKLQANRAAPGVDVWFTTSSVANRAVKDTELFAPIPVDALTYKDDMVDGSYNAGWVGAYAYPLGIVWRPDMVDGDITSWEDLWKPEFENAIAAPTPATYQGRIVLVAAELAGGSIDDVDPGIEKLKQLEPNVAFWYSSDAQARQALANGEISVLVSPPSGAKTVRNEGIEVKMVSPAPAPMTYDVMTIVRNGKEDLAAQFVDFATSPESQQIIATGNQNMPVNTKASVLPELASQYAKPEDTRTYDEDKVNAEYDSWNEKFQMTVSQ